MESETGAQERVDNREKGEPPGMAFPHASITEPEAVLMLATSEKRFEPSYNADITVTRHGVIVNHFLTKEPTDWLFFRRALPSVLSTLGRPEAWIGDGQYGSVANLQLAVQSGVVLYAPVPTGVSPRGDKFSPDAFRHEPTKDVLICPAGHELRKIGTYGDESDHPYDMYARSDCGDCPLKSKCTDASGRRVKRHHLQALVKALEGRMSEVGDRVLRFRATTVEPTNAHLKQHGLGRFHVRGLVRCGTILTLACIAHNLLKWKARNDARALNVAA